jgi:homoserine dehydrogenase
MSGRQLRIGLLGCGNVGGGLVELVTRSHSLIRKRAGVDLSISSILIRDAEKNRVGIDPKLFTTDPNRVIGNGCDLVVELLGGIEPARSLILQALDGGKHVVTANKALLAQEGFKLLEAAESRKLRFGFEASVCGGIPIIRSLRNGFVGDHIHRVTGILNGTCNYVLTRMTEDRMDFQAALAEAQAKGFAEADPTLDIDGHDAAQKLKILAELAFNGSILSNAVHVQGIREITADDIQGARELGYVIKHLGSAELRDRSAYLSVQPVLLPVDHPMARIREENNAVVVHGQAVGEMLFSGKGAGPLPSASAVLADIVDIACHDGGFFPHPGDTLASATDESESRYYLRFVVADPSAIGPVTAALEKNGVGVARAAAVWGKGQASRHHVRVLTNPTTLAIVRKSLADVKALGVHAAKTVALRVEA